MARLDVKTHGFSTSALGGVIINPDAPAAVSQEKPLRRTDDPRAESDVIIVR